MSFLRKRLTAPETWRGRRASVSAGILGRRLRDLDPPLVLTCARGSSDHAATFAKYLVETHALAPVASYAPSASSLYETPWRKLGGTLFLAISQSGHSPDIIMSAHAGQKAGALVVAVVNDSDSPLAQEADVVLPFGPGRAQCPGHDRRR